MEVEEYKESTDDAKKSLGSWKSIPLTIRISAAVALITAYSHFFGYSFLKGKLEAMGFHGSQVNPHVNETLFLASEGMVQGAYNVFVDYLFSTKLLVISGLTSIVFAAVAAATLYGFKLKKWSSSTVRSSKRDGSNKAKAIVIAMMGAFGFAWQFAFVLVVVVALATVWTVMSMGQQLGKSNIDYLIKNGVCVTKIWESISANYLVGCIAIQEDGQEVLGRIIYEEQEKTYFLSNNAAYLLDDSGRIRYKVNISARPTK